jgi:hypothetical protein
MYHAPPLGGARDERMRKSVASPETAVPLILALAMFAISASIGPATRAQTSLECPATFERLRSELNDADEADSTGFNNHYWAVVVNREGLVCAVAYSGRDRGLAMASEPADRGREGLYGQRAEPRARPDLNRTALSVGTAGCAGESAVRAGAGQSCRADRRVRGQLQSVRDAQRSDGRATGRRHCHLRRRACALLWPRPRGRPRPLRRYAVRRSLDGMAPTGQPSADAADAERWDHLERHVRSPPLSERRRHARSDEVGARVALAGHRFREVAAAVRTSRRA